MHAPLYYVLLLSVVIIILWLMSLILSNNIIYYYTYNSTVINYEYNCQGKKSYIKRVMCIYYSFSGLKVIQCIYIIII